MKLRRLVVLFSVVAVAAVVVVLVVHAQSYKVQFLNETLKVSPPRQGEGMRVTLTFDVKNDGATMRRVQIRVLQPCNAKGEGRVFADLTSQSIGRGTTTYNVSGIFQTPTADKNFVLIQFFDRGSSKNPPPLIVQSALRQFVPVTFRLAPLRPARPKS
jgi:hypothetical protein